MKTLPNGYFSHEWKTDDLMRGLRNNSHVSRNSQHLTKCDGAVGRDGVLRTLEPMEVSALLDDPLVVLNDFPFPQLFLTERHVIVCNKISILELRSGALVSVIVGLTGGGKWNLASSHDWAYLSNGTVSVIRDPNTHLYSLSGVAPKVGAICNFNGQIITGYLR